MSWILLEKLLKIKTVFALTQGGENPAGGIYQGGDSGNVGSNVGSSGNGKVIISNPLGEGATIETLLKRILDFFAYEIGPVIVVGVVIYSAALMITSGGNEEKFKKGKTALLYTVIGYSVILVAEALILAIKELLGVAN